VSGPSPASVEVSEATAPDDDVLEAMQRLLPQLSSSPPPFGRRELEALVASPSSILLIARDHGGAVVGTLTLAVFRIPTGVRALIEDVVVDGRARGLGTGTALVGAALARARGAGARTVDLTSRPTREDANRLYLRMGFRARETNVYRYSYDDGG